MNALDLLLKVAKDRTSKEIERLLAEGNVESAKKALEIMKGSNTHHTEGMIGGVNAIKKYHQGKLNDEQFVNEIKKTYYGEEEKKGFNSYRQKQNYVKQVGPSGKVRFLHESELYNNPKEDLKEIKKRVIDNAEYWHPGEKIELKDVSLGKHFGVSKGGRGPSIAPEDIKRAKKYLDLKKDKAQASKQEDILNKVEDKQSQSEVEPKVEPKKVEEPKQEKILNKVEENQSQSKTTEEPIHNNTNTNANSTEPKPEVKTEEVKPSFFKQHWGKMAMGAGALGALGYGAYKYNQNNNNNQQNYRR